MRLCSILILFWSLSVWATASVNVPEGHYIYELYDRLETYGCLQPHITTIHPQSYDDLRQAVYLPEEKNCEAPESVIEESGYLSKPTLPPVASVSPLFLQDDTYSLSGLDAVVTPLFPLRLGRPTHPGANLFGEAYLGAQSGTQTFGYGYGFRVGVVGAFVDYRNPLALFYLQEGWAKAAYHRFEVSYGKIPMGFGNTQHGSLLFSRSMKPMNIFRLSYRPQSGANMTPFSALSIETWFGGLGDSAFVPEPRLWATALAWRPFSELEIALLQVFQFGGLTRPAVSFSDIFGMFFHNDDGTLSSKRVEYFGGQINYWLPSHFAKVYIQMMAPGSTQELSYVAGLFVPRVGQLDFRLEVVGTSLNAYSSALYGQGLSYRGSPIGHPLGEDASAIYADLSLPEVGLWKPSVHFIMESRLLHPAAGLETEKRVGGGLNLYRNWGQTSLLIEGRYVNVTGKQNQAIDQSLFGLRGELKYAFF